MLLEMLCQDGEGQLAGLHTDAPSGLFGSRIRHRPVPFCLRPGPARHCKDESVGMSRIHARCLSDRERGVRWKVSKR